MLVQSLTGEIGDVTLLYVFTFVAFYVWNVVAAQTHLYHNVDRLGDGLGGEELLKDGLDLGPIQTPGLLLINIGKQ